MEKLQTLPLLPVGGTAYIHSVSNSGVIRQRLQDLGFGAGAKVEKVGVSPLGDPSAYCIHGAVIAIRNADASLVTVRSYP